MKPTDNEFAKFQQKATELTNKVQPFIDFADQSQSKSLESYAVSQENSIEKARFSFENSLNDYVRTTKDAVLAADNKAEKELLAAYDDFGTKGV